MKKITFILLLVATTLCNYAQKYANYSFNTLNDNITCDTLKAVDGAKILLERRISEIVINKENNFEELYTFHKKVKIETNNALGSFNKIYIALNRVFEIMEIQARFISKDGKITTLSKENIKEIENLENKGNYKTFAIEGAEVGGTIEYFYVLRKYFNPYGGVNIQDETPRSRVEVIITHPKKMVYIYQYNNNFPEFSTEEDGETVIRKSEINCLKGIREEKYAIYGPNMMGYDFCFAYNNFNNSNRIYNWAKTCQNIYNNIYVFTKSDIKAINKLIVTINPTQSSEEGKIREIENWIKANFKVSKDFEPTDNLASSIKLKQLNSASASKLYVGVFQQLQIPFEYVETGDETTDPFKPNFNAPNFMDYSLFYFPNIKKYLTPDDDTYRLGIIPETFQGAYALFLQPIEFNDKLKTLGYEIRRIPVQSSEENLDHMSIQVKFDNELTGLNVNIERTMYASFGRMLQSFLHLLNDDRKKEFVSTFFQIGKENSEIVSYNFKNSEPHNMGVNPIVCEVTLKNKSMIEFAGNDLLVHIGQVIGEQSELYQENKRELPIVMPSLHKYYREITFIIPDGYTVTNVNELNMRIELLNNGKPSCFFISEVNQTGNTLKIISKEEYTEPTYPASRYDEFRKVINAAADFNKKTILLKKV